MNTVTALVATAGAAILVGLPSHALAHAAPASLTSIEGRVFEQLPSTDHDLMRSSEQILADGANDPSRNEDRAPVDSASRTAAPQHTSDAAPRPHAMAVGTQFVVTQSTGPPPATPEPSVASTAPAPTTPDEPASPDGDSEGDDAWTSILTVMAFFVVSMTGLILFVRAGLRSPDNEEDLP